MKRSEYFKPKAASEIVDIGDASLLLAHTKQSSPNAFTGASA
jgi:hypothetical protein